MPGTVAPDADMGAWLDPSATAAVLVSAGVPYVQSRLVRTSDEVAAATAELGYPLVAKTGDPSIVHKTDLHLVHTGIRTLDEARTAVEADPGRPGSRHVRPACSARRVARNWRSAW